MNRIRKKITLMITLSMQISMILLAGCSFMSDNGQPNITTVQAAEIIDKATEDSLAQQVSTTQTQPEQKKFVDKKPVYYRDQVIILTYHHISENFESDFTITPQIFNTHVELIHNEGFQPISFNKFATFLETGLLEQENAVLITFDDGYESFFRYAYPSLKKYNYPAVQFVIPSKLKNSPENIGDGIPTLSQYQIEQLMESGLVSIQSHTYLLHQMEKQLKPNKQIPLSAPVSGEHKGDLNYQGRLYVDLIMARTALENSLKQKVEALSFPYGFYNDQMINMAKKAGYQYGFTSNYGKVTSETNPFLLPRVDVGRPSIDAEKLAEILQRVAAAKE